MKRSRTHAHRNGKILYTNRISELGLEMSYCLNNSLIVSAIHRDNTGKKPVADLAHDPNKTVVEMVVFAMLRETGILFLSIRANTERGRLEFFGAGAFGPGYGTTIDHAGVFEPDYRITPFAVNAHAIQASAKPEVASVNRGKNNIG
jgi:hypothetical protein